MVRRLTSSRPVIRALRVHSGGVCLHCVGIPGGIIIRMIQARRRRQYGSCRIESRHGIALCLGMRAAVCVTRYRGMVRSRSGAGICRDSARRRSSCCFVSTERVSGRSGRYRSDISLIDGPRDRGMRRGRGIWCLMAGILSNWWIRSRA